MKKGQGYRGYFLPKKRVFGFPSQIGASQVPLSRNGVYFAKKKTGGSVELGWVRPTFVFFCYLFSAASQSIYIVRSTVKCMKKGEKKTCIDMKVVKAGEEGV